MNNLFVWTVLALCPFIFAMNSSLMFFWMILEMSSIMFIYSMFSEEDLKRKEILLTYFLVQSIASSVFLIIIFSYSSNSKLLILQSQMYLIYLVLIIMGFKIALAPLHFWVIKMTKLLAWNSILILLSWQKTIPILMMMKIPFMALICLLACLTLLIGVMTQLKISSIKLLLVYSSMAHLGWMIYPMGVITMIPIIYIFVYTIILMGITFKSNWENFKDLYNQLSNSSFYQLIILMLSLSGIPPLLGFLLKWISLKFMIYSISIAMGFSLMACISFYIYMRMIMKPMMSTSTQVFYPESKKFNTIGMLPNLTLPLFVMLLY